MTDLLMSDGEWLAQLERDPEDVLLKAAYADWLEERDDPAAGALRRMAEGTLVPWLVHHLLDREPYFYIWRPEGARWFRKENACREEHHFFHHRVPYPIAKIMLALGFRGPALHSSMPGKDGWLGYSHRWEAEVALILAYRQWRTPKT